jgi:hypothetical protein
MKVIMLVVVFVLWPLFANAEDATKPQYQNTLLEDDINLNGKKDFVALYAVKDSSDTPGKIALILNQTPGKNLRGIILSETGTPWDEFHPSVRIIKKWKDMVLLEVNNQFGDYISQEIILFSGAKATVLAEYSHGNYDGSSRVKMQNDSIVFEGVDGGKATIEGKQFDFDKAEKKLKCIGRKGFSGFRTKFEPAKKRFSPPENICYEFGK